MNALENWFCGSSIWRLITRNQLLPWMTAGSDLGDHLLELGAGSGAATAALRGRVARVTSLEYSSRGIVRLQTRTGPARNGSSVLQGDASSLPFPDATFSSAVAILMLHHLPCREQQDRAFAEIHRVLRSGGVFLALEIPDGWLNRLIHSKSTFVPVAPASVPARLNAAGFWRNSVDFRSNAFAIRALRAWSHDARRGAVAEPVRVASAVAPSTGQA
jgi:ubiquinone/menaquinone biosynthesis C-methylase UbiE